jgi:hypothetical protein
MELYPWRLDSRHSHCHDDMISILNILKNFQRFWAIAHLRGVLKKNRFERDLATMAYDMASIFQYYCPNLDITKEDVI